MKHDFLSDVERDYLKKIEVNNQIINRQKWYVFLRKQRFSHDIYENIQNLPILLNWEYGLFD